MIRMKIAGVALLALSCALVAFGQGKPGGIKGKVRVDEGATAEGVRVSVRQGAEERAHADTDRNGRFELAGLAPGRYDITFRKTGLKTAEIRDYEISANKVRSLGDRVFMPVDEGSLALLKGSVFNAAGHSLRGAEIELARVLADGKTERIDGRLTNELGQFAFRLLPTAARYRITAKFAGLPPVAKEIDIEGPAVYRIALSVGEPAP
jgi:Carboxypeptidase regulatory-like domain